MEIKYFSAEREAKSPYWSGVYDLCAEKGIALHLEPKDCDISLVLGGRMVNPLPLKGRRVLAFKKDEWRMVKWDMIYAGILKEYYDHFIDTTGLNPEGTLRLIEKECKNL